MKFNKTKLLRNIKISSIILLSLITITSVVLLIYFTLHKESSNVFATKHISWMDWVRKEDAHQGHYKQFIVSPSESRIYIEQEMGKGNPIKLYSIKYIVDVNSASLNSALGIDSTTGLYHFSYFNSLQGTHGKTIDLGIYAPSVKGNKYRMLPMILGIVAFLSMIIATVLYLKGNPSFKVKDILNEIDEVLIGKKIENKEIKETK